MERKRLFSDIQFGAALIAAPIFSLLYSEIFQHKSDNLFWLLSDATSLFLLILLYPLIEELTFRGIIQEYVSQKTKQWKPFLGLSLANLVTSILFVLMHFVYHTPIWAVLTFFPSLVFGYFKERYANVAPSITLHMFYNLCYFSLIGN